MNKNLFKFILVCTFFLFSCEDKKTMAKNKPPYQAGVVLSFDDSYVNEWFEADKKLGHYAWKATFCVSKISTLNHYVLYLMNMADLFMTLSVQIF